MRRRLIAAFLLGSTAIYATPAHAMPPILGVIGGLITALGAPAFGGAIAGAIGFSAAGFALGYGFAGSLIGGILIKAAISLGLSYLASLLRPRPSVPNPGARLVNLRQPISFMDFVYGPCRKGGPINFWQSKNQRRYYDVLLAAHEINGSRAVYADERELTLNGDGEAQGENYIFNSESYLRIVGYKGEPGQGSPALLNDTFTEWTDDHNMEGLAHAVVMARNIHPEHFQKVFPTGREPVITELLEGYRVYDPRDPAQILGDPTTYVYSENAALIIAHWATSPFGLNREVDWEKVEIEAAAADVIVLDRDGNPIPKWRLGGSYSAGEDREFTRAQMGVAADVFFYEDTEGKVGFYVGRYMEPTVTISDLTDDINRIQYTEGQTGPDLANAMSVQYTEPTQGWREATSATYAIDAPDEPYEEDTLSVFWTFVHNQAVRVAKRLLRLARAKYKITATLKWQAVRLIGERFFWLNHTEMGVAMAFEIDRLIRNEDGITWTVEAHSVEPEDFDFDAATEEPEMPKRSKIEDDNTVDPPANITAVSQPYAGSVAIYVDWDAGPTSRLYQVRARVHSPAGEWFTYPVPVGQDYLRIVGLVDGETYDIQARAMTSTGRASKWSPNLAGDENVPTLSVTVVVDPVAPAALTGVSVSGNLLGNYTINFTTPSSANLRFVKHYRAPTGVPLNKTTHLVEPQLPVIFNTTYARAVGDTTRTSLLLNKDFSTGATWSLAGGWAIGGGTANHTASGVADIIRQNAVYASADVIRYAFKTSGISAGTIAPRLDASTSGVLNGTFRATNASWMGTMTAPTMVGTTRFGFVASITFTGSIDDAEAYIQTPTCAPQGTWDIYIEPLNGSGIVGPLAGPFTITVI